MIFYPFSHIFQVLSKMLDGGRGRCSGIGRHSAFGEGVGDWLNPSFNMFSFYVLTTICNTYSILRITQDICMFDLIQFKLNGFLLIWLLCRTHADWGNIRTSKTLQKSRKIKKMLGKRWKVKQNPLKNYEIESSILINDWIISAFLTELSPKRYTHGPFQCCN